MNADEFKKECINVLLASSSLSKNTGEVFLENILLEYENPGRHYHNLLHLMEMSAVIKEYESRLTDYASCLIACLYHDIVYDSKSKENEKLSEQRCRKDLNTIHFAPEKTEFISELILSTEKHKTNSNNFDRKLFLDADLAILGADKKRYENYLTAIRKEYSWVSDSDYIPGRSEVLKSFLKRERIFFTDEINDKLSSIAKQNIQYELDLLAKGKVNG